MTDTIRHHLTDDLLMAYSAGNLPEAFSLVVATHISLCDDCRARAESYDAVGGQVLETSGQMAVSTDSLAATLARIERGPSRSSPAPRKRGVFPAPLQDYVGGDLEAVQWRAVGMGVRQAILPTETGATVRLLHIPAGAAMPHHSHRGREVTLVLQGAFVDADGRFARGDVEVADDAVDHVPVAEAGEDCICLAATEAPLRFRNLLPRLAQPFLKI